MEQLGERNGEDEAESVLFAQTGFGRSHGESGRPTARIELCCDQGPIMEPFKVCGRRWKTKGVRRGRSYYQMSSIPSCLLYLGRYMLSKSNPQDHKVKWA